MRNAGAAVLVLLLGIGLAADAAAASRGKPPRGIKATAGSAPRRDAVLRLGGVQLDLQALRDEALANLKERITAAAEAQAGELRAVFDAETDALAQQIYKDFLYWLNERVRAKLLRQYPHLKTEAAIEEKYAEWLEAPDQELGHYVGLYLSERAPAVQWLLDAYRDEASWEIAGGVKELYEDAQGKLRRFTEVVSDAEREPNAPTTELLRKHGLSGDWIDSFEAHEHRFRTFDEGYRVVEATQTLVSAFQTPVPREKIQHLFDLLALMGASAEDSRAPVVSLFGQIVKAYADVAREMLGQIDRLSKQLRQRAGYCVGAGATGDDRQRAFVRQFGSRDQACPTRLKDVYERTLPADGRIYFFVDGRFRAGREDNGEFPAVLNARALIRAAVAQGDATWQGRENDLAALADVYDVAYASPEFGKGVAGLMREAEATLAGIARRQRELERGLASPCGQPALQRALERETGLRTGESFEPVAGNEQRLAVRFAVGFIRGGGAHNTYSRIWAALRDLSLLQVSGSVVAAGGDACPSCARAALQVVPARLQQLTGCEATHADADGRFVIHALTRAADFRLGLSASGGGLRSAAVDVTSVVVGVDRVPFVKELRGVRLELPVAAAAPASAPAAVTEGRASGAATPSEGVDTSNPDGTAPGRAIPALVPPKPALPPPAPSVAVPSLVGLPAADAERQLAALGLRASLVGGSAPRLRAEEFKVEGQVPSAGTRVPPGSGVEVRVHSAFVEPLRAVPDVGGLSAGAAAARLAAAGLVADIVGGDPAPAAEREFTVQDQRPSAGVRAAQGSHVTVRVYSRFDPRRTVPSVLGLPAGEAEQRLRAAGFTPELSGGDPAPSQSAAFTVQSQEPAAHASLQPGAPVRVRVHSAFVERSAAPSPPAPSGAGPTAPGAVSTREIECPAFGNTPARRSSPATGLPCTYGVEGSELMLWAAWDAGPNVRDSWRLDCGQSTAVGFAPRDPSKCDGSLERPCFWFRTGPYVSMTLRSAARRARVMVLWQRSAPEPLAPAALELAQRLLVEAEKRGLPCDGAPAAPAVAGPSPAPPAPRPAPAQPTPVDTRPACTCRDAAGRPYRMTVFGQDCDPTSSMRSDDCKP